MGPNTFGI